MPTRRLAFALMFSFALAAALAPARTAAADAGGCPTVAGKAATGQVDAGAEPYQLAGNAARYRLADEFQYRLADDSAFRLSGDGRHRLNGVPPCVPSAAATPTAPAGGGAPVFTPAYRVAAGAGAYRALINAAAKSADIQADLLHAVVLVESAYNPGARSPKGAQGLMQLMPATAARYTVTNPYDPAQNLRAGSRHLRHLLTEFDNDLQLALAAYNAGAEAVRRNRNGIPPYPETRDYVRRVVRLYYQRLTPHP